MSLDAPARHAFVQQCYSFGFDCTATPAVPPGNVFVVQTIGLSMNYAGPSTTEFDLTTNGVVASYYLPSASSAFGYDAGLAAVTLYEDSGAAAFCQFRITSITAFSCTLTGYLISVP